VRKQIGPATLGRWPGPPGSGRVSPRAHHRPCVVAFVFQQLLDAQPHDTFLHSEQHSAFDDGDLHLNDDSDPILEGLFRLSDFLLHDGHPVFSVDNLDNVESVLV
jgi:hypothetical protein